MKSSALLLLLFLAFGLVWGRKTAKEWAKFNAAAEMAEEEEEDADELKQKHGLIRVTFGPQYSQHERYALSQTWYEQLLADGIRIKVYGTGDAEGEHSMLIAAKQFGQVWQYFLSHIADFKEVMKVRLDGDPGRLDAEIWNLPTYQAEFDLDSEQMSARSKNAKPANMVGEMPEQLFAGREEI